MRYFLLLASWLLCAAASAQSLPVAPPIAAKAWVLLDYGSGQTLASQNADEAAEPASLTKLMTAYLAFAALRQGRLKLDQPITISEKAWRAQGSRMFVEVGKTVPVELLLKGMIVQSGNDASIALAEAVGGTEEGFVALMNKEAERLGLKATRFRNATGLADPQHMSTARELGLLAAALIRDFPDYYAAYYSLKDFTYNKITQPNRNRLLWLDPAVDGVKTGHTETAGYCLIASAKRGPRRLLSVVLGTSSEGQRAQESQKLLNFGFSAYDAVKLYDHGQAVSRLKVFKGNQASVAAGFENDFVISLPRSLADRMQVQLISKQPLLAPIPLGSRVATLKLSVDGKPWGEFPVVALEDVTVASIFGRAWDTMRLWFE